MPELFSYIKGVLEYFMDHPAAIVPTLIFVLYIMSLIKSVFGATQPRKPQGTNYQGAPSPTQPQPGYQPPPQQTYRPQQPQQPQQPNPPPTGAPPLQPESQRPPQYAPQQAQQSAPQQAREQLGQRALGDQAAVSAGLQQAPQYTPLQAREQLGQRALGEQAAATATGRPQFSIQAAQKPTTPVTSSTQALQQLRAQSDVEAAKTLEATTAEALVAQAASRPARADLATLLGRGDPKRGAFVTGLVLSQVLDRRRPRRPRQMPTPPPSEPSTK